MNATFYSIDIDVGFNRSNYTGVEGDTLDVCISIFNGILGPGVVIDYLITAPRPDPDIPINSNPDTANCKFIMCI